MKHYKLVVNHTSLNEEEEEETYELRTYLWAPSISIREKGMCIFSIDLLDWELSKPSSKKSKVYPKEFSKVSYSFKVPIWESSIEKDHIVSDEWKKQIQDFLEKVNLEWLSQSDFSIQQILMDFSNINIIEINDSVFPWDWKTVYKEKLEKLLKIYFSNIKKSKTPYVIGYGVILKEKKDTSLFHPTGRQYSTSYDNDSSYSSINFLMMAFGNPFPTRDDLSILSKSPLKNLSNTDVKNIPQWVFGIDYELFSEKIIHKIVWEKILKEVLKSIQESVKKNTDSSMKNAFIAVSNQFDSVDIIRSDSIKYEIRDNW
jgi:hypothetical protein